MKEKRDRTLRPFEEIYALTMERAEAWAVGGQQQEQVPLAGAAGRVLAQDIPADRDLPPYHRVAVDGYACRRADLPGPLELTASTAAGDPASHAVEEGCCVKVMTGGVLPSGADLVIMVEHTRDYEEGGRRLVEYTGGGPESVPANYSARGEDITRGRTVLPQDTVLGEHHIALLASVGHSKAPVRRPPAVGILSTGDEVVEPEAAPEAHQVRNANAPQTAAQLRELGIEPRYYGIVHDRLGELESVLGRARQENEVVLVSGGISMGDYDFGPEAMSRNGFSVLYDRVAVKPGRPTTFAVAESADLFGLPGNPVSCFVMVEVLVKPYLYRRMNAAYRPRRCFASMAEEFVREKTAREEWIPVTVDERGEVHPLEYHGSGHFLSLARADGMVRIARGETTLEKGAAVAVRRF